MNIKVKPRNKQNEAKFYTSTKTFTRLKIFFTTENKSWQKWKNDDVMLCLRYIGDDEDCEDD